MAIAKENTVVAFGRPNPMVIDRIPSQIEMYISAEFQRNLPGRALQKLTSFVEKDTVEVSFLIQDKKFEVSFPYKSGDDIKSLTNKAVEDFAIENFPEDFTKKILEKHGMGKQQLLELYLHLHELFGRIDEKRGYIEQTRDKCDGEATPTIESVSDTNVPVTGGTDDSNIGITGGATESSITGTGESDGNDSGNDKQPEQLKQVIPPGYRVAPLGNIGESKDIQSVKATKSDNQKRTPSV